jgi:hypothetical protein
MTTTPRHYLSGRALRLDDGRLHEHVNRAGPGRPNAARDTAPKYSNRTLTVTNDHDRRHNDLAGETACSRRVAVGDVASLAHMAALADDINEAIAQAASDLRDAGYYWAEIGSGSGSPGQAAQQRWSRSGVTQLRLRSSPRRWSTLRIPHPGEASLQRFGMQQKATQRGSEVLRVLAP